jgi:hypothetical protein
MCRLEAEQQEHMFWLRPPPRRKYLFHPHVHVISQCLEAKKNPRQLFQTRPVWALISTNRNVSKWCDLKEKHHRSPKLREFTSQLLILIVYFFWILTRLLVPRIWATQHNAPLKSTKIVRRGFAVISIVDHRILHKAFSPDSWDYSSSKLRSSRMPPPNSEQCWGDWR